MTADRIKNETDEIKKWEEKIERKDYYMKKTNINIISDNMNQ